MYNTKIVINRNGYGSNFNKITIDGDIIDKECINEYGLKKIKNEIKFYNFIIDNNITFPFPKIHKFKENGYSMDFLRDYDSLYKYFYLFDIKTQNIIIEKIYSILNELHSTIELKISKEEFIKQINIEIYDKPLERIKQIEHIIDKYDFIKYVNYVPIMKFNECVISIQNELYKYINQLNEYIFVPIHGDCQFNNIMIHKNLLSKNEINSNEIMFIDPRGYFGNMDIYGIKLYDYAKVNFALSGYDEFDNREIKNLNILNNNIHIDIHILSDSIFDKKIENLLMLSIWLSNAHCFVKNENKCVYSYFTALYLCSLYFIRNKG